jgi:hypothetical protein
MAAPVSFMRRPAVLPAASRHKNVLRTIAVILQ